MADWDILSFSHRLDWSDGIAHTVKFLLPRFARERKVLHFNPPWEWRQAYRHPTRLYKIQDNLWHFEWGRLFPFFRRPPVAARTMAFLRSVAVRWLCQRVGIGEHIYLVWNPVQAPVVQWLPRRFTVYYAYDQFDRYLVTNEAWHTETLRNEQTLIAVSHMGFGVSDLIVASLKSKGLCHAYCMPNGVSAELFEKVGAEPDDIARVPRPRIGYIGGIRTENDWDVFAAVAQRSEWSLVMIGPVSNFLEAHQVSILNDLRRKRNVYFLGSKPHAQIPSYIGALDIGIAPYTQRSAAAYGSTLKVIEYLAAGIPAVATPIPDVVRMEEHVLTALTPEEWISQIERALREDSPQLRRRRQEFAKQHSWDNRAKQVTEIIEKHFDEWVANARG